MIHQKQKRLQLGIGEMTFKTLVLGRIIKRQLGYPRSDFKKRKQGMTKLFPLSLPSSQYEEGS